MANEEVVLTQDGHDQLTAELEELKGTKRREIAERLKQAISYGDLKENGEYHAAKDDQAFMETRIKQIEAMLRVARIVKAESKSNVTVGSTVVLYDEEYDENVEYTIVGQSEADVANFKISYESPLGKTIIGKKVNDTIKVEAPVGTITYKLLEIK
ncbi:MAG: transcription elongation factor GreA [Candidatus Pristimantibacillus lignocellulolyticus]|uniref:Transcription elongation factor GreA n=1 Tax=Candidatus Pristimantibacillus lignocellulolyticus TaxID=2994561 RepID=A0A9J6ZHS9_9BACL|nr:MAG: transcription elongation factor GreA [Candidatus Pristimantibacillus lignocellulolyticus]